MTRPNSPQPFESHDDAQLRGLLHDAVADVQPAPRLDEVLVRAQDQPRRTAWSVALVAAATLAVVAIGVGLWFPLSGGTPPAAAPTPSDAPSVATTDRANVPTYYVGGDEEPRLFREFPFVEAHGSLDLPSLAVEAMLTTAPADPDYRSPWPAGTTATVSYTGGEDGRWEVALANADVDLRRRPAGLTPREAELAVQQLIYTVQAAAGDTQRHPVAVVLAPDELVDASTTVLGVPLGVPARREPMPSALAPVWIVEPADGSRLDVLRVSGAINRPVPFVAWYVSDASGATVASGRADVSAEQVGATYSFTVDGLPSGTYTVAVMRGREPLGAGSGTGLAGDLIDTKEVTVP